MKHAIVTFMYPAALNYVQGFMDCVRKQMDREWTLVIFNDGVDQIADRLPQPDMDVITVDVQGSPTQIRFQAFEWLRNSHYAKIIFQDMDDLMSGNRVRCLSELLDRHELVANDLSLMNAEGVVYAESVWAERLPDGFEFSHDFISDKNILGIGNSAIRKEVLDIPIVFSDTPLVADWFIYYQILFNGRKKALFTTQCQTLYRQHENNMAGIREMSGERLEYAFRVKEKQYQALEEAGIDAATQKESLQEQKAKAASRPDNHKNERHFFWWEETLISSLN